MVRVVNTVLFEVLERRSTSAGAIRWGCVLDVVGIPCTFCCCCCCCCCACGIELGMTIVGGGSGGDKLKLPYVVVVASTPAVAVVSAGSVA